MWRLVERRTGRVLFEHERRDIVEMVAGSPNISARHYEVRRKL